jgi:hypothetical protein
MNTMRYGDSGDTIRNSNDFGNSLPIFVSAMKPIRNLHVTYRGQTYTIREGVSTVGELTARFEQLNNNLGNMGNHITPKGIVWKGQVLKPGDDLSKAGLKNGDRVMILPGDKDTKAIDMIAVYLFLLSSNEKAVEDAISKLRAEQPEIYEDTKETFQFIRDRLNDVSRTDVANFLRDMFDINYHRLRSWWEHPSLRQGLHDPDRIENYRKVVSTNLSARFIKKISSPTTQLHKIIESPELWRREFSKFATKVIRFGDTILEGILDLLLDVLKGRSSSTAKSQQYFSASGEAQPHEAGTLGSLETAGTVTSKMEDPSLANNLLFELSESEDVSDLDEF